MSVAASPASLSGGSSSSMSSDFPRPASSMAAASFAPPLSLGSPPGAAGAAAGAGRRDGSDTTKPPAQARQTAGNKAFSRMLGSASQKQALRSQRVVLDSLQRAHDGICLCFCSAGACELMLFHPVDTITKRLMSTTTKYIQPGQTASNLNQIIFKHAAHAGVLTKAASLFPGLGFAAGYKILQRTYKFGGQPFVNDAINKNAGGWFKRTFGEKQGKTLMQATAGSLIGVGEVMLLPLDVLKIKAQTNPAAFGALRGAGLARMLWSEGRGLYAGAGATMLRNAPGSFALFGGAELCYQYLFHLSDRRDATVAQHLTASVFGSIASIAVSAPLDTIKTRVQNQDFGGTKTGMSVTRDLLRNEGPTALWKGLTPKILMVGPKLCFSMTIANWLMSALTVGSTAHDRH